MWTKLHDKDMEAHQLHEVLNALLCHWGLFHCGVRFSPLLSLCLVLRNFVTMTLTPSCLKNMKAVSVVRAREKRETITMDAKVKIILKMRSGEEWQTLHCFPTRWTVWKWALFWGQRVTYTTCDKGRVSPVAIQVSMTRRNNWKNGKYALCAAGNLCQMLVLLGVQRLSKVKWYWWNFCNKSGMVSVSRPIRIHATSNQVEAAGANVAAV